MSTRKTVLVFRTGHLGDTVCAIPALRLLRRHFADSELVFLCDQPQGAKVPAPAVIERLNLFDRVVTYTSGRGLLSVGQLFRAVRRVQPDTVIMLPQSRDALSNVRRKKRFFERCGVADVRGFQLPHAQRRWHANEAARLVQLLNGMGVPGAKPAYEIAPDVGSRATMERKLQAAGIAPAQPFVLFCGGGKAPTQCWPLERYGAVLTELAQATQYEIVGLGSPHEVAQYRAHILPQFPALRLFTEPLTLTEMFELSRRAVLYVGNDTGPMHVAASVGCPVAVVMSARNAPGSWDPDVEPHLVIRHRTDCEDCF
ncbi:MAG: glycosyltransferase family 9 protein, partial [Blastocatellia bacterium]